MAIRSTLCVTVLALLPLGSGCGETVLEDGPASLGGVGNPTSEGKRALWNRLLPPVPLNKGGGSSRIELAPGRPPDTLGVDGPLHASAGKDEVRRYVAAVLRYSDVLRSTFSAEDPEVQSLMSVGHTNIDILIEPLRYVDSLNPTIYLTTAISRLTEDEHRGVVLANLATAPELIHVVEARGWEEDAAKTLLSVLHERPRHLRTAWIVACAKVASLEHRHDLRFQLATGDNPYWIWRAIRYSPGVGPLDDLVGRAWAEADPGNNSERWRQMAVVAAHYGHIRGLSVLVERLAKRHEWWGVFQKLTGFGRDREDFGRVRDAQRWFASNREMLVYDRSSRRYVIKQ